MTGGVGGEPVADRPQDWPVAESKVVFEGPLVGVRRDTLVDADGSTFDRDVVTHKGAVGVVAVDPDDRVLVVSQYRHPARARLAELPAGLLDQPGEDPLAAARRELAEEAHVRAERWSQLLRLRTSSGMTDEVITIFLAEDVAPTDPPEGFEAVHEEATMIRGWVPLEELVEAALSGRISNASLVAGALALRARRDRRAIGS